MQSYEIVIEVYKVKKIMCKSDKILIISGKQSLIPILNANFCVIISLATMKGLL